MTSEEDIFANEIESWKGFEYALRQDNRILFNKMMSNKEEYAGCVNAKDKNFTETLFLVLIYEQHKMIAELIARLSDIKRRS